MFSRLLHSDVPAKECKSWANGTSHLENHCHANDTHQHSDYWKQRRQLVKAQKEAGQGSNNTNDSNHLAANLKYGPGPFPPTDTRAAQDPNLTQCRKCQYYNRFFHRNFTRYKRLHPTGFLDWCMKCGRVASHRDFAKQQREPIMEQPGDVCLGKKLVSFRIKPHDPRVMKRYQDSWEEHEDEWTFDEDEMREDLFQHRFGERPTLAMILQSIPIVKEDDMPIDGSTYLYPSRYEYSYASTYTNSAADRMYEDHCGPKKDLFQYWLHDDWLHDEEENKVASADETEGIILEKSVDILLFRQLRHFERHGYCARQAPTKTNNGKKSLLSYDITAKWDKENQVGVSC